MRRAAFWTPLIAAILVAGPAVYAEGTWQGYTILAFDATSPGMIRSTTNVDYAVDIIYCSDGCRYKMTGYHYIAWSRYGDVIA